MNALPQTITGLSSRGDTLPGQAPYRATIVRFKDADTVLVSIYLTFDVWIQKTIRLVEVESWELKSPDRMQALTARDALDNRFTGAACRLRLTRLHPDCYGRYRGKITVNDGDLGTIIVGMGLAWPVSRSHTHANPDPTPLNRVIII